jgi:hypothetical protein
MTRRFAVLCYGLFASGTYGHYNAPNFEPGSPRGHPRGVVGAL